MPTITLQTAASQATDVFIRDCGIVVPASGAAVLTFTDMATIEAIRNSNDILPYITDDIGGGNTALIITDGTATWSAVGSTNGRKFLQAELTPTNTTNSQTTSSTTSSASYVQLPSTDISLTVKGYYLVRFSGTIGNSGAGNDTFISLFVDGVQDTGTERKADNLAANFRVVMSTMANIFVNTPPAAAEIRWRTTAGTATCEVRKIVAVRIPEGYGTANP